MVSGVRTIRVLGRSVSCTAMQSEDLDCRAHGPEIWNRRACVYVCLSQRYAQGGLFGHRRFGPAGSGLKKHRRAEHAPIESYRSCKHVEHLFFLMTWEGQDVGLLSDSRQNEM